MTKIQKRPCTNPDALVPLALSKRRAPVMYKEAGNSESAATDTDAVPPLGPTLVETVDLSSSDEEDKKQTAQPKQKRSGTIVRKQHPQSSVGSSLFQDHGTYQTPYDANQFCQECTQTHPEEDCTTELEELLEGQENSTESNKPTDADGDDFNAADVTFANHHPKGSSPVQMYRSPTESEHVRIGFLEQQLAAANKRVAELTNNVRASNEIARYQQKAHVAERGKLN